VFLRVFLLTQAVSFMAKGQENPALQQALARVAEAAANLRRIAPVVSAREILKQKVVRKKVKKGAPRDDPGTPVLETREIVSWYGYSTLSIAPRSWREFRRIVSVEEKPLDKSPESRERFVSELAAESDSPKEAMLKEFEKGGLVGAATDFGQVLLLFTKGNQAKYVYKMGELNRVGADPARVLLFEQLAGHEALRITDGGKKLKERLNGEIWVRQSDGVPLRVTLVAVRRIRPNEVRDEARVDYEPGSLGAVLPVSVVYRRFVNDELTVENVFEYSDWQKGAAR
jgi:hypothetical protein